MSDNQALQNGFIGCLICAMNADNYVHDDEIDQIMDILTFRSIFKGVSVGELFTENLAMYKVLKDKDPFLKLCCQRLTDEWKPTVFAIVVNMLMKDSLVSDEERIPFLNRVKSYMELPEDTSRKILEVMDTLYKGK